MADTSTTNYELVLPEPNASDDAWGLKLNDNFITIDELIHILQVNLQNSVPAGAVQAFAMADAPTSWLSADGSWHLKATYPNLWNAIQDTYLNGEAPRETEFRVPDMRGEFVRGWDNSRGVDAARTLGSNQAQDWKGFFQTNTGQNTNAYSHNNVYMGKSTTEYIGNLFVGYWAAPAAAMGTRWDDSEIRPRNIALHYCIKT